jgi:hypothetical protein
MRHVATLDLPGTRRDEPFYLETHAAPFYRKGEQYAPVWPTLEAAITGMAELQKPSFPKSGDLWGEYVSAIVRHPDGYRPHAMYQHGWRHGLLGVFPDSIGGPPQQLHFAPPPSSSGPAPTVNGQRVYFRGVMSNIDPEPRLGTLVEAPGSPVEAFVGDGWYIRRGELRRL